MKSCQILGPVVVGLLMIPGVGRSAEATSPYTEMAAHYEAIRLVLLADTVDGMRGHAKAIEDLAKDLLANLEAGSSSVPSEKTATFKAALEEIRSAASNLAATDSLDSARERFFALTKPLARYRKLSGDETTIVAYCSMAQKAWIQPEGEIGNPYMGQQMPRCGEVVGE